MAGFSTTSAAKQTLARTRLQAPVRAHTLRRDTMKNSLTGRSALGPSCLVTVEGGRSCRQASRSPITSRSSNNSAVAILVAELPAGVCARKCPNGTQMVVEMRASLWCEVQWLSLTGGRCLHAARALETLPARGCPRFKQHFESSGVHRTLFPCLHCVFLHCSANFVRSAGHGSAALHKSTYHLDQSLIRLQQLNTLLKECPQRQQQRPQAAAGAPQAASMLP